MATTRQDRSRHRRPIAVPLYDARYEHDACGVGFVADAGGRSRDRVLPLALAGLASLGHRGAFGADGESSDGAGVALPLDRIRPGAAAGDLRRRPAGGRLRVPAPRPRLRSPRPARSSRPSSPRPGCRWPAGARSRSTRRRSAPPPAASRPGFAHAIVARPARAADDPRPLADDAFERRLVVARRRLETAVRDAGGALAELAVPSASCRTIVYKGLVTGGRLPQLFPDLRAPLSVGYTVFHQRYATNTHPVWKLAQPFRSIAHNGEINTVRGNREQVRGRSGDLGAKPIAAELLAAGPLLSPDGSDSLSLDESLELLMTTGWELTPALLASIPEAPGAPALAASARRDPPPPDRRVPRAVGRAGRDRLLRRPARRRAGRPQRAAARVVRGDPRPAGRRGLRGRRGAVRGRRHDPAWPPRAGRAAAGRAGPPVDHGGRRGEGAGPPRAADPRRAAADPRGPPGGGRARAGARIAADGAAAALPRRPRRRARPPRHQDDGARGPRAALEHGRRHADRRPRPARPARRRPPPPGVRPGHEPGDRPRARAHRDGPAGGAGPSAGAARRVPARAADAAPRPADRRRPRRAARRAARGRDAGQGARRDVGRRGRGRLASRPPSTGSRSTPSRPPAPGPRSSSCPTSASRSTGCRSRRSSAPASSTRR